jgi:two-component system, NarL family, nitrate/nitrite response regulator NarL
VNRGGVKTRVAIVDDHVLFAECLQVALTVAGYDDCRLIPVAPSAGAPIALLSNILRAHAGVVIVDIDLANGRGGECLIEPIASSGAAVVVVTADPDRSRWGESLLRGARTVVPKSSPLSAVTSAIRRIDQHAPAMAPEQRQELVRTYHQERSQRSMLRARLARLSTRESEILGHLMAGRTVADIARACVVSEATVRTQVRSILTKLEVSSQIAAVGLAYTAEWRPVQQQRRAEVGLHAVR